MSFSELSSHVFQHTSNGSTDLIGSRYQTGRYRTGADRTQPALNSMVRLSSGINITDGVEGGDGDVLPPGQTASAPVVPLPHGMLSFSF